jgi:uncharacterized membrane protein
MKKLIISGIAVVVPFALTGWVLVTVFGSIDAWVNSYLLQLIGFGFPGLGLLLLLGTVIVAGIAAQTTIGRWFYNLVNRIVFRVPLINKIYKLIKETVDVITRNQSFKTVVKIEFPKNGVYSIGFLTNKNTVFVPTTPNPTSGFLIKTDKYEVLDMNVEEALRYVISMGSIQNNPE